MSGKQMRSLLLSFLGLGLLFAGAVFLKLWEEPQGVFRVLPYLCIGIGCGIFGGFMGEFTSGQALKKHPELLKQIEIEQRDERNVAVSNRAKAKAYDIALYVFAALCLALALMQAAMEIVLLLVAAYLFVAGCGIYYRVKYEKEM